jgi:hypothetical protein
MFLHRKWWSTGITSEQVTAITDNTKSRNHTEQAAIVDNTMEVTQVTKI